jgi:hypothetical protein
MAIYEYWPSDDGTGYHIWFKYHESLVAAIKEVPFLYRSWDAEEKLWYVDNAWFKDACRYLDAAVARVAGSSQGAGRERKTNQKRVYEEQRREQRQDTWNRPTANSDPIAAAFRTLYLLPEAPLPVVKAVYRALALLRHPDTDGSHEQMRDLNLAYEKAAAFAAKR